MISNAIICRFLILIASAYCIVAWTQWNYTTQWWVNGGTDQQINEEIALKKNLFYGIWSNQTLDGSTMDGPRARRGHTMVIARTPAGIPPFNGGTFILMFGGRDNTNYTEHVPKTYNIEKVNGTITFSTYEDKPVNPCADTQGLFYSDEQRANCNGTTTKVAIGKIYNDVWAYRICNESSGERFFAQSCVSNGWQLLHAGGAEGGCTIELGILVCTVPSERYHHGAVMYNDQTMYVYGGFSERCVDYCDDIWFYDMYVGVSG